MLSSSNSNQPDIQPLEIRPWINTHWFDLSNELIQKLVKRVKEGKVNEAVNLTFKALKADDRFSLIEHDSVLMDLAVSALCDLKIKGFWMKDPQHIPDPAKDIERYFRELSGTYKRILINLADQMPAVHPDCRASVFIPVAAHDEADYIYKTLQSFTNQDAPLSSFEVVLFLNFPNELKSNARVENTFQQIEKFKNDYPDFPLYHCSASLEGSKIKRIGMICSIAAEVALLRHYRLQNCNDPILIRCDADIRGLKPTFISNYLSQFAANPKVDSFKSGTSWSTENFGKDPLLYVNLTICSWLHSIATISHDTRGMTGPNFAIKGSMYAYMGGYPEYVTVGEDFTFLTGLVELRDTCWNNEYKAVKFAGPKSNLFTSSRRAESAHAKQIISISQWSNKESAFKVDDVNRRQINYPENYEIDKNQIIKKSQSIINKAIKEYSNLYDGFSAYTRGIGKAISMVLGFDFEITKNGEIKILNADRFFAKWEKLRASECN